MFNQDNSHHVNEAAVAVVTVAVVAAVAGGVIAYKQGSNAAELPQQQATSSADVPEQGATAHSDGGVQQPHASEQGTDAGTANAARAAQLDRALSAIGAFPDALTTTAFSADDPSTPLSFTVPDSLQQAVDAFENEGFGASFVLYDLNTGKGLYRDADAYYWSASTVKAPFVTYLAQDVLDKGRASKSDHLQETETVQGTGVMATDDKTDYTLEEVIENTVEHSDNTGYQMLWNEYHDGLPAWAQSVGSTDQEWATEQYPFYTPRTVAQLWCGIDRYLNSDGANASWLHSVLDLSSDSFIRSGLAGRADVKEVMAKPGFSTDLGMGQSTAGLHDAGVVSTKSGDYLVVIMTTCPYDSTGDTHYGAYLEDLAAALDECRTQLIGA